MDSLKSVTGDGSCSWTTESRLPDVRLQRVQRLMVYLDVPYILFSDYLSCLGSQSSRRLPLLQFKIPYGTVSISLLMRNRCWVSNTLAGLPSGISTLGGWFLWGTKHPIATWWRFPPTPSRRIQASIQHLPDDTGRDSGSSRISCV